MKNLALYPIVGALVAIVVLAVLAARYEDGVDETKVEVQRYCIEELIPALLHKPAGLWSGVNTTKDQNDNYRVTGLVDTYNPFDVPTQMSFVCGVHRSGDRWRVDELRAEPFIR